MDQEQRVTDGAVQGSVDDVVRLTSHRVPGGRLDLLRYDLEGVCGAELLGGPPRVGIHRPERVCPGEPAQHDRLWVRARSRALSCVGRGPRRLHLLELGEAVL